MNSHIKYTYNQTCAEGCNAQLATNQHGQAAVFISRLLSRESPRRIGASVQGLIAAMWCEWLYPLYLLAFFIAMKFVVNDSYWIAWSVYLTMMCYLILMVIFIITDGASIICIWLYPCSYNAVGKADICYCFWTTERCTFHVGNVNMADRCCIYSPSKYSIFLIHPIFLPSSWLLQEDWVTYWKESFNIQAIPL